MRSRGASQGFTLVEVLIAMAITALVSIIAYSGLSAALIGLDFGIRIHPGNPGAVRQK